MPSGISMLGRVTQSLNDEFFFWYPGTQICTNFVHNFVHIFCTQFCTHFLYTILYTFFVHIFCTQFCTKIDLTRNDLENHIFILFKMFNKIKILYVYQFILIQVSLCLPIFKKNISSIGLWVSDFTFFALFFFHVNKM